MKLIVDIRAKKDMDEEEVDNWNDLELRSRIITELETEWRRILRSEGATDVTVVIDVEE